MRPRREEAGARPGRDALGRGIFRGAAAVVGGVVRTRAHRARIRGILGLTHTPRAPATARASRTMKRSASEAEDSAAGRGAVLGAAARKARLDDGSNAALELDIDSRTT